VTDPVILSYGPYAKGLAFQEAYSAQWEKMVAEHPEVLTNEQRRDLLEIVEDRYNARSLLITSQIPVKQWYDIIGNSTLADAILDRIVHRSAEEVLAKIRDELGLSTVPSSDKGRTLAFAAMRATSSTSARTV
jgi:hypothetical protein